MKHTRRFQRSKAHLEVAAREARRRLFVHRGIRTMTGLIAVLGESRRHQRITVTREQFAELKRIADSDGSQMDAYRYIKAQGINVHPFGHVEVVVDDRRPIIHAGWTEPIDHELDKFRYAQMLTDHSEKLAGPSASMMEGMFGGSFL